MSDILERIKELKKKKSALNQEAAKIREDFENYITDQSIPLGERWDLFSQSPDELNNHMKYIIKAKSDGLISLLSYRFDAPEVYGRGKRIDTKKLFDDIFEDEQLNYDTEYYDEESIKLNKEAMEEILSQNCGSFCLDW
jgi:hypothetical protein